MIKSTTATAIALVMAMGLAAGTASAAQEKSQQQGQMECGPEASGTDVMTRFKRLDSDSNGAISEEEFKACMAASGGGQEIEGQAKMHFTALDNDGDGKVTEEEFKKAGAGMQSQTGMQSGSSQAGAGQSSQSDLSSSSSGTQAQGQGQSDIVVTQPAPTVTVEQPKPQVEVQQDKPDVTVKQTGEPTVKVEESAQAGASGQTGASTSEQSGQAGASASGQAEQGAQTSGQLSTSQSTTGQESTTGQAQVEGQASGQATTGQTTETAGMSEDKIEQIRAQANEIIGRNVVNARGEEVGEVEDLVVGADGREIQAVVSVGGFLGIGEKEVLVPFEELQIGADNVVWMVEQSEDELKAMPEYKKDEWQSLQQPEQPKQQ